MRIERFCLGTFQVNCYVIISDLGHAIIIDPGAEADKIKRFLRYTRVAPHFILHTHGHIDHIGADRDFSLPVYIHKKDFIFLKDPELNLSQYLTQPFTVDNEIITFDSKDSLNLDEVRLEVIHTPGHTPGSCCFLLVDHQKKILFSGDTLFYSAIGRTDFLAASYDELLKSIKEKLFLLDDDTLVYPGHGTYTRIGKERVTNPLLK
ncbi:MAG: MBL fold metallo-hydrolase [Candidatus Omnitrophica bacterium]|nr:MBL fold metallo-hydrolase [Candidatus Omnitrophota bacterium]